MARTISTIARMLVTAGLLVAFAAPVSAADTTNVRVLHASPDAPAVDVYLDDAIVAPLTNVPFGTISDYLPVPAGDHNVKVYATGTTDAPVIDADVTVVAGTSYTIAATNPVASITAHVIEDTPSADCADAQVRVVHFSSDAPAVDIATAGAAPADAVIKNLAFPSASDYLDLPGGTYDLEVRLAGEATVALALPDVTIEDCNSYSAFAVGSAASPAVGGNALQVVVAVDATATAAEPTLPQTDTVSEPATSATGGPAAILLVAAVVGFLGSLAVSMRRVRQD